MYKRGLIIQNRQRAPKIKFPKYKANEMNRQLKRRKNIFVGQDMALTFPEDLCVVNIDG